MTTKTKWRRIFDGCWHLFAGERLLAIVEQNDYGRRLWSVYVPGKGKITDGVHDCFPFSDAKKLVRACLADTARI